MKTLTRNNYASLLQAFLRDGAFPLRTVALALDCSEPLCPTLR